MPIKCGINVNISNLQGEITSKLSGFVDLSGTLGTPAGLAAIKAQLASAIASIKGKFELLIPEIPTIPQSLRDDLATLAALPAGGVAALAKIAQFATDYLGITDLKGFANIDLNDLANSVFSVTGTFDPCSAVANIPNVIKDPVTGALVKLPSIQPDLGATLVAESNLILQEVTNNFDTATVNNAVLSATDTMETTLSNLQTNIEPAVSGLGDMIRKLPSGMQELQTQAAFITEFKQRASILQEV
jgi:hypothetical protein